MWTNVSAAIQECQQGFQKCSKMFITCWKLPYQPCTDSLKMVSSTNTTFIDVVLAKSPQPLTMNCSKIIRSPVYEPDTVMLKLALASCTVQGSPQIFPQYKAGHVLHP